MNKRPSPSESATLFKIGTIKQGNDGNFWIIIKNKNGVKKWQKYSDTKEKEHIQIKNDMIVEFKFKPTSVKKIGKIQIKSKIVVGEFSYSPNNGFPKFGKGNYYVYSLDDNLVISKLNLTKSDIVKTVFKYTDASVGVDVGTFGFWDKIYIDELIKVEQELYSGSKSGKRKSKSIFKSIPYNHSPELAINQDVVFVTIKDFQNAKEYIDYGFDEDQVVGVIGNTGTGDGYFHCYSDSKNTMLLLLGGNTSMILYENVEDELPPHLEIVKKYRQRKTSRKTSRRTSKKSSRKTSRKTSRKSSRK